MSTSSEAPKASNPTNPPKRNVPKTASEWVTAAVDSQGQYPTLHTLSKVNSASKLTFTDFAAMRALWPTMRKPKQFKPGFDGRAVDKAREVVEDFPELHAYIQQVRKPGTGAVDRDMGAFFPCERVPETDPVEVSPMCRKAPI